MRGMVLTKKREWTKKEELMLVEADKKFNGNWI